MKNHNGDIYVTIGVVSEEIGRGAVTIKNWYEWAERNGRLDDLPEIKNDFDARGTRYFKKSDIPKLKKFRDSIKYGMMADLNREKWGERGRNINKKKINGGK